MPLDGGARHGELGAASDADDAGKRRGGEESFESGGIGSFAGLGATAVGFELQFGGTAEEPDAAEIGVAGGEEVGKLEILE